MRKILVTSWSWPTSRQQPTPASTSRTAVSGRKPQKGRHPTASPQTATPREDLHFQRHQPATPNVSITCHDQSNPGTHPVLAGPNSPAKKVRPLRTLQLRPQTERPYKDRCSTVTCRHRLLGPASRFPIASTASWYWYSSTTRRLAFLSWRSYQEPTVNSSATIQAPQNKTGLESPMYSPSTAPNTPPARLTYAGKKFIDNLNNRRVKERAVRALTK